MNLKSAVLGVSAATLAASVSVFAASAPAHAFLVFSPFGTQLDGDDIFDILADPGDRVDFSLSIDTRAFGSFSKAVSEFTFRFNWDSNELAIQPTTSFLSPNSPFQTFSRSGNQITLSGGNGISRPGLYELGTISFIALNTVNDGLADFGVRYDVGQLYSLQSGFLTQSVEVQPVPTPALLPGLVGLGVAALRRKKDETAEEAA